MSKTELKALITCQNKNCEFFGKSEEDGGRFIGVVYYQETHDFELSDDGTIGTNLTVKEGEDMHVGFNIHDIRCRHCDESFDIPKEFETEFPDTLLKDISTLVKEK